ncbi:FKBP-type peptidyl-prolyl cis-trans isomerase [Hyphomonas sp.]|uniref:FKBP-type peptidyl-prolyl cis-trans isomerase n=1 Tax=Hyphomonas sp. TaxID=87 RepID=UPI001D3823BB|nr:FKBP-type peptidyl-prolyl cis-trans isomerase [Hyphomonas sp.]
MKRILAVAASAALVLLAACGGGEKAPTDVDAVFEQHLPWNPDAKGVQTDDTGLQWIVIREGDGKGATPAVSDLVRVNYEGRTANGDKFDSSFDRGKPAMFRLNQVIPGWTIGLQKMHEGDQYLFYVPNKLAYGNSDRGAVIKAGDDLVFLVDLVDLMEPKSVDTAAWEKYTPWNHDAPDVKKTGSGLEYVVLASGDEGAASPVNGQQVVVYYEGRLAETGEMFDSAFQRGAPEIFPSNRLIRGWVEALSMMKPGDRWLLYIPSDLAYGKKGTPGGPIPADADLVFEVELADVLN